MTTFDSDVNTAILLIQKALYSISLESYTQGIFMFEHLMSHLGCLFK